MGNAFFQASGNSFEKIAEDPERHPEVGRGFRRLVMQQFPYAVFYEFDNDEIIVVSIFNCSRDPQIGKERIKQL